MTRGEAWFAHVSNLLVGGTGVVYGWMRYFAEPPDEFSVVNHPWQPDLLYLHILFAPLVVFSVGLVWREHVWKRVRSGFRARRRMGLTLTAVVFPMIASGYLVQLTVSEGWKDVWIVVHVATSCAWVLAYLVHQLSPRKTLNP